MRINQNIAAFNAYRNLSNTQGAQAKSLEKLSSGFRINRASDDASGLVNSENLRSQIGGLKVASRALHLGARPLGGLRSALVGLRQRHGDRVRSVLGSVGVRGRGRVGARRRGGAR